jgi:acyl carrier protein phosphodiesterase
MNFLAHLYLAEDSPEALIGSILPDLARPRDLARTGQDTDKLCGRRLSVPPDMPAHPEYPPAMLRAIAQHRAVDAFTDTHPIVYRSKQRLHHRPRMYRYAGILMDVFYDHFLARDWARYSQVPLPRFVARVHEAFRGHTHLMPQAMRYPVERMIAQDWLGSYATESGVEMVLRRMSLRLSQRFEREVKLEPAVADLARHREALSADFQEFFPQLVAFASAHKTEGRVALTRPALGPCQCSQAGGRH